ncbi:hypothetical protein IWW36_001514 [Coemansia brasiliensis]|uniref:F-box domain-containing protein n=1 Tax=Coemansia brasiliensis TaxID=2650707 RepID=A0A9W8LYY8_9FUNG|nr:hypothetical protein IWW36_001514 [Coemansia brasiliensis]
MCLSRLIQMLPAPIIENIVWFMTNNYRHHHYANTRYSEAHQMLKLRLLGVCRSWREVILAELCSLYRIQLFNDGSTSANLLSWPTYIEPPSFTFAHWVKEVLVEVDYRYILCGQALQKLSKALAQSSLKFVAARKLHITFVSMNTYTGMPIQPFVDNVNEFIEYLKQAIPDTTRVVIRFCQEQAPLNGNLTVPLGLLLSQLYSLAKDITFKGSGRPLLIPMHSHTGLCRIEYDWDSSSSYYVEMIRHNVQALQMLQIKATRDHNIASLVYGESGQPMVYHNMRRLILKLRPKPKDIARPMVEGTPFPSLGQLYITGQYPFGDDTLFRGNCKTLVDLRIPVDVQIMHMLNKSKVSETGYLERLRHLEVTEIEALAENEVSSSITISKFAMQLASSIQSLCINSRNYAFNISNTIYDTSLCHNLRYLSISNSSFSAYTILMLVKSLPLLTDLETKISYIGNFPGCYHTQKLPKYVAKSMRPISQNFKCLTLLSGRYISSKSLALVGLLISIACPNFSYMAMPACYLDDYNYELRKLVHKPGFTGYAGQIRSLIFDGW